MLYGMEYLFGQFEALFLAVAHSTFSCISSLLPSVAVDKAEKALGLCKACLLSNNKNIFHADTELSTNAEYSPILAI